MFGNNNQDNSNDQQTQPTSNDLPSLGQEEGVPTLPPMPASAQAASPFGDPQQAPSSDDTTADESAAPSAPTTVEQPEPAAPVDSAVHHPSGHGSDMNGANGDLVAIKQQALQHLSPLVSHLDQSAEEKFRTTMMMIQATDDQSLLKTAYEAAQKIEDDKARAQALLDVINEINYFTQQHSA